MKRYKLTFGYLFIFFVFTFSCRPEGEVVRADIQNFTFQDQAKIGNELAQHIIDNPSRYNLLRPSQNQKIYMYLNTVLATIVNTPTVENRDIFDWKMYVIRDDEHKSAFTLPGGKIYITSAFLKFLNNEAQLFSVLSHEMCYADHSLAMTQLQENHSGLILGDIIFNNPVEDKDAIIETLLNEQYDFDKVLRADLYSIDALCQFQYESQGLNSILDNVTDENFPLDWLNTRPSYEGRPDTISTRSFNCGATILQEERYRECVLSVLD